jgi:hypothetical protein
MKMKITLVLFLQFVFFFSSYCQSDSLIASLRYRYQGNEELKKYGDDFLVAGTNGYCVNPFISRRNLNLEKIWSWDGRPGYSVVRLLEILPDSSILFAYLSCCGEIPEPNSGVEAVKLNPDGIEAAHTTFVYPYGSVSYGILEDSVFLVGTIDSIWRMNTDLDVMERIKYPIEFKSIFTLREKSQIGLVFRTEIRFYDGNFDSLFSVPLVSGFELTTSTDNVFLYDSTSIYQLDFDNQVFELFYEDSNIKIETVYQEGEDLIIAAGEMGGDKSIFKLNLNDKSLSTVGEISNPLIQWDRMLDFDTLKIFTGFHHSPELTDHHIDVDVPFIFKSKESEITPIHNASVQEVNFLDIPVLRLEGMVGNTGIYRPVFSGDHRIEVVIQNFGQDTLRSFELANQGMSLIYCGDARIVKYYESLSIPPDEIFIDTILWRPDYEYDFQPGNIPSFEFCFFTFLPNGYFDNDYTDDGFCAEADYIVSTKEPDISHHFTISPNPVSDHFTLQFDGNKPLEIELLNSLGQVIHREKVQSSSQWQWNRKNEPSGMYFLHIKSEEGRGVKTIIFE